MAAAPIIERFRAARRNPRVAVLEGLHALKHALRFGAEIVEVAALNPSEVARLARNLAPDVADRVIALAREVDSDTFAVLSPASVPTGVMAIAERPDVDIATAFQANGPAPIVVLERVSSPFNAGAAIRVAAAAGAAGLFVTGTVDPWGPTAVRASAGLGWALPVAHVLHMPSTDRPIVALDPAGEPMQPDVIPPRAILAFGQERVGLSRETLEAADLRVRIPMRAGVSSLNVATAVAAVLYGMRHDGRQ